jgi:aflatoxin B1 aldehyde reductase
LCSVYQGLYNVWHRAVESELIPCLRHYGMSLYCFNPLAGGFLTGRYHRAQKEHDEGERFDPTRWQGKLHRGRYWYVYMSPLVPLPAFPPFPF